MQSPLDQGQNSVNTPVPIPDPIPTQASDPVQSDQPKNRTSAMDYMSPTNKPGIPTGEPNLVEQTPAPESVETTPTPEKQPVTEIFKAHETAPEPQPIQNPQQPVNNIEISPVAVKQAPIKEVVDKSAEPLTLHKLDQTVDKLTTIADEEEERFIQKVEAAHDNK